MPAFEVEVPTRWGDLDALAHVNNGTFVDYLQEARVALLLRGPDGTGPVAELLGGGVIVAEHQVEYRRPLVDLSSGVQVRIWVEKLGAARFTLGYRVSSGGVELAVARSVACPYDFSAERVRRLTAGEREFFSTVVDAEPLGLRSLPALEAAKDAPTHDYAMVVRWSDLDSYRHVNNVRFYDYLQQGRVAMAKAGQLPTTGTFVVARQDVKYLRQLQHRVDPYRVRTTLAATGNRSIRLLSAIDDPVSGEVFATATTVVVTTNGSAD